MKRRRFQRVAYFMCRGVLHRQTIDHPRLWVAQVVIYRLWRHIFFVPSLARPHHESFYGFQPA